ncbi:MAG: Hpt domain-containing protein, partial [Thermoanaerobaculia bacterium]
SEEDDLLREILDLFRKDVALRLQTIDEALAAKDPEAMWQAAHALRSGAANLGAMRVVSLCDALQDLGRSNSIVGADAMHRDLRHACGRALAELAELNQAPH